MQHHVHTNVVAQSGQLKDTMEALVDALRESSKRSFATEFGVQGKVRTIEADIGSSIQVEFESKNTNIIFGG